MAVTLDLVEIPIIGQKYHVKWAGDSAAFRLVDVGEKYAVIKADSKKKLLVAELSDLRHTSASAKHFNQFK